MNFDLDDMKMVMLRNRRARAIVDVGVFGIITMGAAIGLCLAKEALGEVIIGMAFAAAATGAALSAFDAYRVNRSVKLAENTRHGK